MPGSPGRNDTTPYGRACNHCVKAKAKCTLRGDGKACERCFRLKKDCQPAVGARRKPGRKPAASKTDELEARLNGLVSLLENVPGLNQQQLQQQRQKSGTSSRASRSSSAVAPAAPALPRQSIFFSNKTITYSPHEICIGGVQQPMQIDDDDDDIDEDGDDNGHGGDDAPHPGSNNRPGRGPAAAAASLFTDIPGLTALEAEEALQRFCTRKLKYFPFVHIPPMLSAARLQQTRPLLWLSIMACSARSAELQTRLCLRLRQQIAEQAVVNHQRSIDLLLGVVGFLGWGMYYLKRDPFMLMYCHMATAIVQDLGIDREPPVPPRQLSAADTHPLSSVRTHGFAIKLLQSPVRTNEERRAVLGAYLVTVIVTLFHRKPTAVPWTEHMDDCLRVLDTDPETPLDRLLVYQCRLQRLALDVPGSQVYATITSAEQMRLLRDFQVKSLLARQREVEQMCPTNLPDDLAFICRLSNLANEASIYSVALYSTNQSAEERLRCGPDTQRAALLATCLRLHKDWFDLMFGSRRQRQQQNSSSGPTTGSSAGYSAGYSAGSGASSDAATHVPSVADEPLPDDSFFYMFSFHMVAQLSYFFVVVYRLANFEKDDPSCGWDKHWARAQLDVPGMVDTIAARFAEVSVHFADHGSIGQSATAPTMPPKPQGEAAFPDFFTRSARAMSMLRATWVAGWAKEQREEAAAQDNGQQQQQQAQPEQQEQEPEINSSRMEQSFSFSLLNTGPDDSLQFDGLTADGLDFDLSGSMNTWLADIYTSDWGLQQ
ncbi:hypothetical protein SCUCBS95973_007070 [Sporothrix curviconia]|uniref:Zn(2)-C6 fungal-type domain-containing protein n=1 Tax=Sporothrix curviconia TaxID=1260050 RepID=A0ABP0CAE1_9PEZI